MAKRNFIASVIGTIPRLQPAYFSRFYVSGTRQNLTMCRPPFSTNKSIQTQSKTESPATSWQCIPRAGCFDLCALGASTSVHGRTGVFMLWELWTRSGRMHVNHNALEKCTPKRLLCSVAKEGATEGDEISTVAKEGDEIRDAYCLNVSSWFYLPELEMDSEELLSRGSAFLVPWRGVTGSEDRLHLCTSAHIVHPFKFPHYYKEQWEWLQRVKETNVTCYLEVRSAKGDLMFKQILCEEVFRHPERDVAVLHLVEDDVVLAELKSLGKCVTSFAPNQATVEEELWFVGNRKLEGNEDQGQIPEVVSGRYIGHGGTYSFAETDSVLQMGMCGGPVLNMDKQCVGLTEAIVGSGGPKDLVGKAVLIDAHDIVIPFLESVADKVEDVTEEGEN